MSSAHALAALIEQRKESNGWSNNDIGQRAARAGHQLSGKNVWRLTTQPVITLKAETMRALASGLDLPVMEVVQAALLSMGFKVTEGRATPEEAVAADPALSSEAKRMLLAQLEALRTGGEKPETELTATLRKLDAGFTDADRANIISLALQSPAMREQLAARRGPKDD